MAKKCKKCGIVQNDERTICIECGNFLGKPLSKEESKHYNEEIVSTIRKVNQETIALVFENLPVPVIFVGA